VAHHILHTCSWDRTSPLLEQPEKKVTKISNKNIGSACHNNLQKERKNTNNTMGVL
jgi:hypothetical protein